MSGVLVTTTETVPPWTITRTLGIVVASIPVFGSTYAELIKDLNGETTVNVSGALEARRVAVLKRLIEAASARGANAVIGVRFEFREITKIWKEMCAYGTAVTVAK